MTARPVVDRDAEMPPEVALQTSAAIAAKLVEDAVWSGERCTWVGAEPMERVRAGLPESGPATRLTYRALGPDLYAGTSGVALYLAELAAATGHSDAHRTALGALRNALSRHGDVEPTVRCGFYAGWSRIAYAAIRVGGLLHVPELVERGRDLLGDVARQVQSPAAGNAECIMEAGPVVGMSTIGTDLPARVARHGVEHYAVTGLSWPCGTHTGETPNLMLGLAGIGYFYLRWAAPEVPSILMPVGPGDRH